MDSEFDGIAAGLSNCITKDGQTTITQNIPFNGKKITNLGTPTASTDAATKAYVDGAAFGGNRNKIINGNFSVNQRGVSGAVTLAAGAYGHDRWKAGLSGCTYTYSTDGTDTIITITSGSLAQVVESRNVEAGTYTLSWTGTATARAAISGVSTSGAYASGPITTGSAAAGQTITVEFTLGTVGRVQLERSGAATAFERRPYGVELFLCQRYYEKGFTKVLGSGHTAGCYISSHTSFAVPKRVVPSITNLGTLVNNFMSGLSQSEIREDSFTSQGTTTEATAAGEWVYGWAANAEL